MREQLALWATGSPMQSGANLSDCGRYRYLLWRGWYGITTDWPRNAVNFVMLNPSTADATDDDPTIRRCVGYGRAWGFDGIIVTNLFAWRATDPAELKRSPDPIGNPENDAHIQRAARHSSLVVCAWGNHGGGERAREVLRLIRLAGAEPHALKMTGLRQPAHPLYLPGDLKPFPLHGLEGWNARTSL